jgi:hypothetical protein
MSDDEFIPEEEAWDDDSPIVPPRPLQPPPPPPPQSRLPDLQDMMRNIMGMGGIGGMMDDIRGFGGHQGVAAPPRAFLKQYKAYSTAILESKEGRGGLSGRDNVMFGGSSE